jgi:hypothetical protein
MLLMRNYLKKRIESFRPRYKRAYTQIYDRTKTNLTMKDFVESMAHQCKLQDDYIKLLEEKLETQETAGCKGPQ